MQVVEFRTEYPVGKDPVDKVLIAPTGANFDKTRTWLRIKEVTPPDGVDLKTQQSDHYKAMIARWNIIKPRYEAWKAGQDLPEDGTPLEAWAALTKEKVAALKGMGIRTVEAVRDMDDKAIAMCRWPDARKLPELAKSYLESADAAARDAENAELKERLAAMEEMLSAQMGESKPKRGRPKKEDSA